MQKNLVSGYPNDPYIFGPPFLKLFGLLKPIFRIFNRQMADNGFALPPPREFCRHIISCRELKAKFFKKCLHSVRWGVSL